MSKQWISYRKIKKRAKKREAEFYNDILMRGVDKYPNRDIIQDHNWQDIIRYNIPKQILKTYKGYYFNHYVNRYKVGYKCMGGEWYYTKKGKIRHRRKSYKNYSEIFEMFYPERQKNEV